MVDFYFKFPISCLYHISYLFVFVAGVAWLLRLLISSLLWLHGLISHMFLVLRCWWMLNLCYSGSSIRYGICFVDFVLLQIDYMGCVLLAFSSRLVFFSCSLEFLLCCVVLYFCVSQLCMLPVSFVTMSCCYTYSYCVLVSCMCAAVIWYLC